MIVIWVFNYYFNDFIEIWVGLVIENLLNWKYVYILKEYVKIGYSDLDDMVRCIKSY